MTGPPTASLTLDRLPSAPPGRVGWPWTAAPAASLPANLPGGQPWPRLTVVTPSYNQGQYIEETIRSVLLQGYPNLEYFVLDGGSTDDSREIIRRYAPWLDFWVSEPDGGQSQAINRGLAAASGQILAWLNSDDTYLPGALATAAAALHADPGIQLVYGSALFVDRQTEKIGTYKGKPLRPGPARMQYWRGWPVPQPSMFFRRQVIEQFGCLDESFQYALDYEWVIRVSRRARLACLPQILATYRLHTDSKSGGAGDWNERKAVFFRECQRANRMHAPLRNPANWPLWLAYLVYRLGVVRGARP